MTTYLSIDVATKSLALGIYKIDASADTDQIIIPIAMQVHDMNPNKLAKTMSVGEKAASLKRILNTFDEHIPSGEFVVLIEYQMNANHMSNAIFNMIVYHYATRAPIHTVYPAQKNTICLHPKLTLAHFLGTASTNYAANKNHCKFNFLYFIVLFEHGDKIKHIKQKNLDDIADTFMQCLAFHKKPTRT